MSKKTKSKEIGVQILTGHQVVAQIFDHRTQYISDIVNKRRPDNKGVINEFEQYAQLQKAYIKKRKIILGINKKS